MTDLPAEAVTAAAEVLTKALTVPGREPTPGQLDTDWALAKLVLEAAAPHITAAATTAEADLLETAWVVIANAGWDADDRDVAGRPDAWHEAAVRWRDRYREWLREHLGANGEREDTP